jgi:hypothetical protein
MLINSKLTNAIRRNKVTFIISVFLFAIELMLFIWLLTDTGNKKVEVALKILPFLILGFGYTTLKDFFSLTPVDLKKEQQTSEDAITFLEDKGIFHIAFSLEHPKACHESAKEIRGKLTEIMKGIRVTKAYDYISNLRQECFDFMRNLEQNNLHLVSYDSQLTPTQKNLFYKLLQDFRDNSKKPISSLAKEYGINIKGYLSNFLNDTSVLS